MYGRKVTDHCITLYFSLMIVLEAFKWSLENAQLIYTFFPFSSSWIWVQTNHDGMIESPKLGFQIMVHEDCFSQSHEAQHNVRHV